MEDQGPFRRRSRSFQLRANERFVQGLGEVALRSPLGLGAVAGRL